MSQLEIDQLVSSLPKRIARLGELAYNLWWTWHPEAPKLFQRIHPVLWESVYHNPIKLLRQVPRKALAEAYQDSRFLEIYDRVVDEYTRYMNPSVNGNRPWFPQNHGQWDRPVAYFSFEFGLHESLPMYAGGLGVLAADHLKAASDLGLPMVGIGFLYLQGYFRQRITEDGWQEADFELLDFSQLPITRVNSSDGSPMLLPIDLLSRTIWVQVWKAQVGRVALYLMDTDVAQNAPQDRQLTYRLYSPDPDTRIAQEIVLGIGGVRALRALDIDPIVWHMNEGHPAFGTLERAREFIEAEHITFEQAKERVCQKTVFTTHTPVPAGNDAFAIWQIDKQLNGYWEKLNLTRDEFLALAEHNGSYGMTVLALRMSEKSNAVSELHGQVARKMWSWMYPGRETPISYITNGVHTRSWLSSRMRRLYDEYMGVGWINRTDDPATWAPVYEMPDDQLWDVHKHNKRRLAEFMRDRARTKWITHRQHPVQTIASGVLIDPNVLTIGFARRFATYKRAALILRDVERLLKIVNNPGRPVQILFAGKAHPNDEPGKLLIQQLYRLIKNADSAGRLVFIEDYDLNVARYLVRGVDVWLNTPRRPYEASGTSGMKAALNGALNFSVLDGWWREAYNGKNGWAIGDDNDFDDLEMQDRADTESIYSTLENEIVPLYYDVEYDNIPHKWLERVKESIATIVPRFSTRRMLKQYINEAYVPLATAGQSARAGESVAQTVPQDTK
ncbi:MAG: alpha-glucan family phosphorylase [Chloroflexi bacterium]|nr:alpha-glucan family phosphorylase [Chloroflexota bacterium]